MVQLHALALNKKQKEKHMVLFLVIMALGFIALGATSPAPNFGPGIGR